MYCLLVYAQLVVLTSLIYRFLRFCPVAPYAFGFLALVERERRLPWSVRNALPHVQAIFAVWLTFCVVGLDWERWRGYVEGKGAHDVLNFRSLVPLAFISPFATGRDTEHALIEFSQAHNWLV